MSCEGYVEGWTLYEMDAKVCGLKLGKTVGLDSGFWK